MHNPPCTAYAPNLIIHSTTPSPDHTGGGVVLFQCLFQSVTAVVGGAEKSLLDSQKSVVFCDAVGA